MGMQNGMEQSMEHVETTMIVQTLFLEKCVANVEAVRMSAEI